MPSWCGGPPTTAVPFRRQGGCSGSRCSISPSCSPPCRWTGSWPGCWSPGYRPNERRNDRRPPPGRYRHARPPTRQEPVRGRVPAGARGDLLPAHPGAHGRPGMSAAPDRNARLAWRLVAIVGGMLALAYAASPLYEMFCKATGFAGTPIGAQEGAQGEGRPVLSRTVTVRFDSNVDPNLSWRFQPVEREVKVRLGEEKLVYFRATNGSPRPSVGPRTYNRPPEPAGPWFNKLQCFCFTEQLLQPGQSVDMPVVFFVDPEMDKDRRYDNIRPVTLSYTFFEPQTQRARTLLGGIPANGSGKGG